MVVLRHSTYYWVLYRTTTFSYVYEMVRKSVEIPDELWREFEVHAVRKFGYYGAIKKALEESYG